MYSYKIKEPNEDLNKAVIEKSGVTVDFTIAQMDEEQAALTKYLKEFEANRTVKQTMKDNIEEYHPFVKDLTEEQLFTAALYQQVIEAIKQYDEKTIDFTKQLSESRKEVLEIISQIGITPKQVEAIAPDKDGE
jgi:predicted GNAT family acetyltransferase